MALPAIQRRVGRLECVFVPDRLAGFPPLGRAEIEALVERTAGGQKWSEIDRARIARECPYTGGELIIREFRGEIMIKRLVGIDMATDV